MTSGILRIGHSPDADDAFMFFALAHAHVCVNGYRVEHVMEDIESLNRRALRGELEVTAISAAVYPAVADRYRILDAGASMGRNYGPIVVSTNPCAMDDLRGKRIAIPGVHTTAYLLLRLRLAAFEPIPVPFDAIPEAVLAGRADAGLLIHEGQITYPQLGLSLVADLGRWWQSETGLPLPLGLDVVRRDLGGALGARIGKALGESIQYAFAHEPEALAYAAQFGRGVAPETLRTFVRMYVNDLTETMGREGREALQTLYRRAVQAQLIDTMPDVDPL
ncbi:MAG: ABC transporter substrate-binding protein [Gammaproteobacteria bacterium]|nr:ABC transporter substrate-binding protein [Gammaproteobacteria bacterium]